MKYNIRFVLFIVLLMKNLHFYQDIGNLITVTPNKIIKDDDRALIIMFTSRVVAKAARLLSWWDITKCHYLSLFPNSLYIHIWKASIIQWNHLEIIYWNKYQYYWEYNMEKLGLGHKIIGKACRLKTQQNSVGLS